MPVVQVVGSEQNLHENNGGYMKKRLYWSISVSMESGVKIVMLLSSRMKNTLPRSLESNHSNGSSSPVLLATHPTSYPSAL